MSNELAVRNETVKSLLANASYKKRFEEVLGKRAPQFMASISNAAQLPGLAKCEPKSVLAAAFVAATLDLPIDRNLGFAWIIPYKTNVKNGNGWTEMQIAQFQMGWKGYVQLAARTGLYSRMNAFAINKEAVIGFDDCGEREIDFSKWDESKEIAGYAFVWKLTNGFRKCVYWPKEKVLAHAGRYSQAYRAKKKDSPWINNFDAMAIKTVVKNSLARWGILSVEMRDALKHDTGAQVDIDADVTPAELSDGEMIDAETIPDESPEDLGASGTDTRVGAESPKSNTARTEAAPNAGALSTQQHLEHLITKDWGFTFDRFRQWAGNTGQIKDADGLSSFAEVPLEIAERLLRNKAGMKSQLEKL